MQDVYKKLDSIPPFFKDIGSRTFVDPPSGTKTTPGESSGGRPMRCRLVAVVVKGSSLRLFHQNRSERWGSQAAVGYGFGQLAPMTLSSSSRLVTFVGFSLGAKVRQEKFWPHAGF